ncbi:hypothetical protein L1887_46962 [Cichorium endivia]|nr:hypothetical protein L1887_46962 [Cichorium endivia]
MGSTSAILLDSTGSTALDSQRAARPDPGERCHQRDHPGRPRPPRAVAHRDQQQRHRRFPWRLRDPGHRRSGRGQRRPAHPGARRREHRRVRCGGRQGRHGSQQHQGQRAGQRAARCLGQPRGRGHSTARMCGSTCATWYASPPAPMATPRTAGTPLAACWKSPATSAPRATRWVSGWPRAGSVRFTGNEPGDPAGLADQPVRRHPRRAERLHQADLAQGQRRAFVRAVRRPRRSALRRHLPRLRNLQRTLEPDPHLLQPADRRLAAATRTATPSAAMPAAWWSARPMRCCRAISSAQCFQGDSQTQAAQAGLDGYNQSQKAVARGAQLIVGEYTPYYVKSSGLLQYALGASAQTVQRVDIASGLGVDAGTIGLEDSVDGTRQGTLSLDSDLLNSFGLGGLKISALESVEVNDALQLADGGELGLFAQACRYQRRPDRSCRGDRGR